MYFKGKDVTLTGYCKCKNIKGVYCVCEEWGYWDVCSNCNKPLDGEFHYYNHFDGEDFDDADLY